jgi:hypothetical protein
MTLLSPTQAEEHLSQVAQQFAQWRQSRPNSRGSRIPEPLWAEAVTLATVVPLTRVARSLGLKPHALKRRCSDTPSALVSPRPTPPASPAAAFVEVRADVGRPATAEVEVQRPDGARLRITYHDATPALAALLQPFLEPR